MDFVVAYRDVGSLFILASFYAYSVTVEPVFVSFVSVVILAAQVMDVAIDDINVIGTRIDPYAAGTFR